MTDASPERLTDAQAGDTHERRVLPIVDLPPATGPFASRLFIVR
jgi:hypothetical protein